MADIIHVNKNNFKDVVVEGEVPVLADFSATWCGPCKMLVPVLEQVAQDMEGKVVIAKIDIDESIDIAQQFGVMSVPTMVLFEKGVEIARVVGFRQKVQIEELINSKIKG